MHMMHDEWVSYGHLCQHLNVCASVLVLCVGHVWLCVHVYIIACIVCYVLVCLHVLVYLCTCVCM